MLVLAFGWCPITYLTPQKSVYILYRNWLKFGVNVAAAAFLSLFGSHIHKAYLVITRL